MKNKFISLVAIFALILTGMEFSYSKPASADDSLKEIQQQIEDLQKRQKDTKNRTGEVSDEKGQTQAKIDANNAEQRKINAQIKAIDDKVADTQAKLRDKEAEIKQTEEAITQKEQEIVEMQERIKQRDELLKNRLRTLQKNGGSISYLEVMMGAKNFGDFLDRTTAVTKIMDQDKKIMEKHISEKQALEDKKQELVTEKADLEKQKQDLENLRATLEQQRKEKDQLMKKLQQQEQELKDYKLELEEQEEILIKQQASIKRLLEKAKQDKERLEMLAQSKVNPGGFARPVANGRITSTFGARWGETHFGIDIGKRVPGSHVPILAAADGIVTRSYYSSSYGNVVFLTHYINGQVYTTVYAHMQNREVSEGQEVNQGQRLGYMGTTGDSTGPHLHFELHKGPWTYDKRNAIDPLKFIKF